MSIDGDLVAEVATERMTNNLAPLSTRVIRDVLMEAKTFEVRHVLGLVSAARGAADLMSVTTAD
jgi:hypothetical protein